MGAHASTDPLSFSALAVRAGRFVLAAVLLGLFTRTFVLQAYVVASSSMADTLLPGDHVVIGKMTFRDDGRWLPARSVRRGDPVLIARHDPHRMLIKRCAAIGGDRVTLGPEGVTVTFGGAGAPPPGDGVWQTWDVPDGHLFLLGDNRDGSRDSRAWGTVPTSSVRGRPWLVYLSFRAEREDWSKIDRGRFKPWRAGRIRWDRFPRFVR